MDAEYSVEMYDFVRYFRKWFSGSERAASYVKKVYI